MNTTVCTPDTWSCAVCIVTHDTDVNTCMLCVIGLNALQLSIHFGLGLSLVTVYSHLQLRYFLPTFSGDIVDNHFTSYLPASFPFNRGYDLKRET